MVVEKSLVTSTFCHSLRYARQYDEFVSSRKAGHLNPGSHILNATAGDGIAHDM